MEAGRMRYERADDDFFAPRKAGNERRVLR